MTALLLGRGYPQGFVFTESLILDISRRDMRAEEGDDPFGNCVKLICDLMSHDGCSQVKFEYIDSVEYFRWFATSINRYGRPLQISVDQLSEDIFTLDASTHHEQVERFHLTASYMKTISDKFTLRMSPPAVTQVRSTYHSPREAILAMDAPVYALFEDSVDADSLHYFQGLGVDECDTILKNLEGRVYGVSLFEPESSVEMDDGSDSDMSTSSLFSVLEEDEASNSPASQF